MSFSSKDPSESIVVTFDFSALMQHVDTVSVAIEVAEGNDANVSSMLSGSPFVTQQHHVSQRIINGVDGCTYHIRCTAAETGGNTYVLANTLPVTRF